MVPCTVKSGKAAPTSTEPSPRQYAQRIAILPTLQKRREALARVPKHLQELVKTHLSIRHERLKYEKEQAEIAALPDTR